MEKRISFLVLALVPMAMFGSQENSQNKKIGYSKEQGLIKAQQLVKFFTSLTEAGSQENKISYSKGQGLDFDFPSDSKEKQTIAQKLVESLHKQNLTTRDVFKDYLEQHRTTVNKAITEATNLSSSVIDDLTYFGLEQFKKKCSMKAQIIFKDTFNESVQRLVQDTFKKVQVPYCIVVKKYKKKDEIQAQIRVRGNLSQEVSILLELPWHLWGDDKGCKNIAEKEARKAAGIMTHEATHAKWGHVFREAIIINFLEKVGCEQKKIKEIRTYIDMLDEREADLLPFMNDSTTFCMEHKFRTYIDNKVERPQGYLQLDELKKIISLHDAERSILKRQERWDKDKEAWTKAIEVTFVRNGVPSLLHSSFIPPHMKLYALSKMPEAKNKKFL